MPRPRMVELYLRSPTRLHGIMLNQLSTGITLPFAVSFAAVICAVDKLLKNKNNIRCH
jgi:hypothetical protein